VAIKEAHLPDQKQELIHEAKGMLKVIRHVGIVNLQGIALNNNNGVCLLIEYCVFGGLDGYLQKKAAAFEEGAKNRNEYDWLLGITLQVASAMVWMGGQGIIHVSQLLNVKIFDNFFE
jgi:hypothetical protein